MSNKDFYYKMLKDLLFYKDYYKKMVDNCIIELFGLPSNKRDYLQLNIAKDTLNNINNLISEINKCLYTYSEAYTSNDEAMHGYTIAYSNVLGESYNTY